MENSTIPVIETGTGNCHIYVDESANLEMAVNIINNAKTQRIGVCNACESIVVHEKVEKALLAALKKKLDEHQVELRCDDRALSALGGTSEKVVAATEQDWGREYLDYILSIQVPWSSLDEAIAHINRYNTRSFRSDHHGIITQMHSVFWMRSTQQPYMSMHRHGLPMALNLALVQRSVSAHRSCMRADRWD